MKPKFYVLMITILLMGLTMLSRVFAIQAQSAPDAPASASGNYLLPLVMGSSFDIPTPAPTPTPTATPTPNPTPAQATAIKSKSGIHMGNRGSDWNPAYFARIGDNSDGAWPAAVVVQSDQLFDYVRQADDQCRISSVSVKQVDGKDYDLYRYLTSAIITHTVKVVIRISPSPGNFSDFAGPGDTHTLLASETPAGGDYCGDYETQKTKVHQYRDILDIAKEMQAIYRLNLDHGWSSDQFFFEPANEPNYEWYWKLLKEDKIVDLDPNINGKAAWEAMDNYFAALYDRAKEDYPNLQVLSPPMAQKLYGEHFGLGSCDIWTVQDGLPRSGLDFMKKSYGYDFDAGSFSQPPAKADGFSLHNYWRYAQESWDGSNGGVSLDFYCGYFNGGSTTLKPAGEHISQYFPDGMAIQMRQSGKPVFITEADLVSPCQDSRSLVFSKDRGFDPAHPEIGQINNPPLVQSSLTKFIQQESWANYVNIWVLVNEYNGNAACDTNTEINWHEAYLENGAEREWFGLWWPETP